jgi:hypothetical protein
VSADASNLKLFMLLNETASIIDSSVRTKAG